MMAAPLSVLAALHFPNDFHFDYNPSVTVQFNVHVHTALTAALFPVKPI